MSTFLVTGGAGFIGSNIVRKLVQLGEKVRILDNLSTGKESNLADLEGKVDFIVGDIRDYHTALKAVTGVDYVLHQAALPSVQRSIGNPIASSEVNVQGTLNLLCAARKARVKRFVYASSSSIYGNSEILPKSEDMPSRPMSPYAISKMAGEEYCKCFYHIYGMESVCLRYFNVFGPRQNPDSQYAAVIPKFIHAMVNGGELVVFGNGEQSRDFTYVDNVVEANLLACHASGVAGEVINIACGERYSVNFLIETLRDILDHDASPIYEPAKPGDVKHSLADISKARALLNYNPRIHFVEGLRKTVEWIVEQYAREEANAGTPVTNLKF